MVEIFVALCVFVFNTIVGALVLTLAFKLFDDSLRGQYLKEAFFASLRYNALVNGALFLVGVIGMVAGSVELIGFLSLLVSIGSIVLMAKMFALGLKELIVMYCILFLVSLGIVTLAETLNWGFSFG